MIDHRIHRALTAAGALLLALYATVWLGALRHEQATGDARGPEPSAAHTNDGGERLYYRVTTSRGETHVIDVSPVDAAQAVLTATQRFGAGASLERLEGAQALAARRAHRDRGVRQRPRPKTLWLGVILLVPAWFLLSGHAMRSRFRRLDAVFNALRERLGCPAEEAMRLANIDQAGLHSALQTINERAGTELVWDEHTGVIVDARLSRFVLVLAFCPRCNARVNARVRADLLDTPCCSSCMACFEGQELDHQRAQIVQRLLSDDPTAPSRRPPTSRFSLWVFALWAALLPPVAIMYAQGSARS